jgi:hypothetical protein
LMASAQILQKDRLWDPHPVSNVTEVLSFKETETIGELLGVVVWEIRHNSNSPR